MASLAIALTIPAGLVLATSGPAAAAGAPVVTDVAATSGPIAGGTIVTISGSGFTGATAVDFGPTAATTFHVNSDVSITATSPAQVTKVVGNTVDVTVTSGGNTSAAGVDDEFTYTYNTTATPAPNTLSITAPATPASAVPLNQNVTLTGTAGSDVSVTPYGFSLLDVTDASTPVVLAHVGSMPGRWLPPGCRSPPPEPTATWPSSIIAHPYLSARSRVPRAARDCRRCAGDHHVGERADSHLHLPDRRAARWWQDGDGHRHQPHRCHRRRLWCHGSDELHPGLGHLSHRHRPGGVRDG